MEDRGIGDFVGLILIGLWRELEADWSHSGIDGNRETLRDWREWGDLGSCVMCGSMAA